MACNPADLEKKAKDVFKQFDADGSGSIDSKEVENAVRKISKEHKLNLSDAEIKKQAADFIKDADDNKDGKVSFKEFHDFVCGMIKGLNKK